MQPSETELKCGKTNTNIKYPPPLPPPHPYTHLLYENFLQCMSLRMRNVPPAWQTCAVALNSVEEAEARGIDRTFTDPSTSS